MTEGITVIDNTKASEDDVVSLEEAKKQGIKGEPVMVETDIEDDEEEKKEEEDDKKPEEEEEKSEETPKEEPEYEEEIIDASVYQEIKKKALNYDMLVPEFNRKSTELAELRKNKPTEVTNKGLELSDEVIKKIADDNGWGEETTKASVTLVKTLLPYLGLMDSSKLAEHEYEKEKKYQIDLFMDKHPEYKPDNDADASRWNKLTSYFFDTYQLPKDPKVIASRLAKAHEEVFPKEKKNDPNADYAKTVIKIRKAKMAGSGGGGGNGQSNSSKEIKLTSSQMHRLEQDGWTEKEILEMYGE